MSGQRIAAVVLAGGRSSRFGRDKLDLEIDGRRLLDRALDAVQSVADEVVVVTPPGDPRAFGRDIRVVHDARPFEGPLVGLASGLTALGDVVDRVIVVGGDMPTLVPDVLRRLLGELDTAAASVLADGERGRPLPMAMRRASAVDGATALVRNGERSLRALVSVLDASVVSESTWRALDPTGATLRDVDTPTDL